MEKIMIIEDDYNISKELKELLNNNSYDAIILEDFKNPIKEIEKIKPNLILLDINIPSLSGELLLQKLREISNVPVIIVTSNNSETLEALTISYGADDYITKPYNPNILLLRIGAVLKRANLENNIYSYKDLKINISKGVIEAKDKEVVLTKNEIIIFTYLLNHQSKIVTREELMTTLWDNLEYINENALTVNISRLRNKLKEIGYKDAIKTRKGLGYILS